MDFPTPSKLTTAFSDQSINRPQFHFTPEFGWMNDPNGLWTDGKTYHLYYQYNPADTVWALPLYWGHATSEDLITWTHVTEKTLPIGPVGIDNNGYKDEVDPESGAYSGSIFIDDDNQSGWFHEETADGQNYKRVVAAWTYNYPDNEAQWLSFSLDGGYTFNNPLRDNKPVNPMVSEKEKTFHFRDPQVIKLNDTKKIDGKDKHVYIMTVAKPQEYKIYFYASTEISSGWDKQIDLELEGFLGYQYECPNLIHLYNANTAKDDFVDEDYKESYWVLFISINPGSITGGSSTWYLIGQFGKNEEKDNKYEFTPTYHYPAPLDYGKDFYAMQIMYNSGEYVDDTKDIGKGYKSYIGIAWASNWQYTGLVPTDPWRSSMSLARKVSLGFFQSSPERKILYVKSQPIEKLLDKEYFPCVNDTNLESTYTKESSKFYEINPVTSSFKFDMEYNVNSSNFSNVNPGHLDIEFICEDPSEYLLIGYENEASAFYVDRSHSNVEFVHKNPYFSDKISVNVQPISDKDKVKSFKVLGFVDRNIIELFFNDGYQTMTNTFFFTGGNFFNNITISADHGTNGFDITTFRFCPFSK